MPDSWRLCVLPLLLLSLGACRSSEEAMNILENLVSQYGYIAHKNPMELFATGGLVTGNPATLRLDAEASRCFPMDSVSRVYNDMHFNREHHYETSGGLEAFGIGSSTSHVVHIELGDMMIEYIPSIDITSWYREGMGELCREYLNYTTGLIAESLIAGRVKLSVSNQNGTRVALDRNILTSLLPYNTGVSWDVVDEYSLEINSPVNLGYKLVKIREDDVGFVSKWATEVEDGHFVFEEFSLKYPCHRNPWMDQWPSGWSR